jgi:Lon protease-like protein
VHAGRRPCAARRYDPAVAALSDVPLFPLGLVLLPGERLPLHIFEPRYRELIARCSEAPEPFCIAWADTRGIRTTGCLADHIDVIERFEDGRLNVVVTGTERVRIDEIDDQAHAYLSAAVETVPDSGDEPAVDVVDDALAAFRDLVSTAAQDPSATVEDLAAGPRLSYAIAARVDFGNDVKQALLESRSERARLVDVAQLVRTADRGLRVQHAVAARARTNGKVTPADEILDAD